MWNKLDKLLTHRLNSLGLKETSTASHICYIASKIRASGNFRPIKFIRGALTVGVENNYVAQEIKFEENALIKKINQKLGKDLVNKIKYQIGF